MPNSDEDTKSGSDKSEKSKEVYADKKDDGQTKSQEGIDLSEDFQQRAHEMINSCSAAECKHIHDKAYAREEELRKKDSKDKPKDFSDADMPS